VTGVSFSSLAVVLAVAFVAPLALGLVPRLRVPAVVLEIVLGIVIGPQVLGWARLDQPVQILSLVGLAFLLFLAGLEIDFDQLRGQLLRVAAIAFGASLAVALVAGLALEAAGLVHDALLGGVILTATSLGLVIPVLKEGGHIDSRLGQLVIAGSSIADFSAVVLLSLLFSRDTSDTTTELVLLGVFVAAVALVIVVLTRRGRSMAISRVLIRLQDTTAQIRVRGAMLLLLLLVVLAQNLGLETILGAFVAGAIVSVIDRDAVQTHPLFRVKLEAIGYGFLVPVFFVTSGMRFDLNALLDQPSTLLRVPVFLVALLIVRGLPAFLYRPVVGTRSSVAAGLLQATSLPFIVTATQIGVVLGAVSAGTAAAFVAAGLLSALLFPAASLAPLRTCAVVVDPADRDGRGTGPGGPTLDAR
jgi:Kef-type K+ transport system membrane component KefB